jgi:hypothetical protein
MGQDIFDQCTRDDGSIVKSVETGKKRGNFFTSVRETTEKLLRV